jgi:hypothetical protein
LILGRLYGFKYRKVVRKLRRAGFELAVMQKAAMKSGGIPKQEDEQLCPITPEQFQKEL